MSDDALERRFPRRLLLGGGAAAAALAAVDAIRPTPAAAAPTTNPWTLGGNNLSTDGTNFIGAKNKAPIIFKTPKTDGSSLVERLRITPVGDVGIATASPTARLDVVGNGAVSVQGRSTVATTTGVQGVSATGFGVRGQATGTGTGVRGDSASNIGVDGRGGFAGVQGEGTSYGGIFQGDASGSYGMYASGGATGAYATGATRGVYASGDTGVYGGGSAFGVVGNATASASSGVYGSAPGSGAAKGVWGHGGQYAVFGDAGYTAGVRGDSGYVGLWGEAPTYGANIISTGTSGQTFGVYAKCNSAAGFAVYAAGNVAVAGTLSKSAGSFRIDHPLDPERRWLSHSFVESPDMMNVYNGNVVLGKDGTAGVELPAYFEVLNREFRYQLTCIGGHAPVYVAEEVDGNRFAIAGGMPGLKVSWQVTGIRQDDYAKAHPIVVDTPKAKTEVGTRMFVPAGSSAKSMQLGPTAPPVGGAVPAVPAAVPAPR